MSEASRNGLYTALLEVQKNAPHLKKDATAKVKTKSGSDFSYSYMTLGALLSEVLPGLHEHGVVLTQGPAEIAGHPALETKLVHAASGEELASVTPLLLSPNSDSQAWGGAITYARRYSLISMLGLAAEDDDGQTAQKKQDPPRGRAEQPKQMTRDEAVAELRERQKKLARLDQAWTQESIFSHVSAQLGEPVKKWEDLPDEAVEQLLKAARQATSGIEENLGIEGPATEFKAPEGARGSAA